MSRSNLVWALCLVLAAGSGLGAQQAPRRLSLEEAVELAKRNNPRFASVRNDQEAADWEVRESYASLLPFVSASAGATYVEPGTQRLGTVDLGTANTDYLFSSYGLNMSWSLNAGSMFQVAAARAGRDATAAGIRSEEFNLESAVTAQYMTALRARDAVEVARRILDVAQQNLELATVRAETGAAAGLDAKQAQVARGRAEVSLIQAQRADRSERLRLAEQLGVPVAEDLELVTGAEPFEPTWSLDDLLGQAVEAHPALRAAQARERSGRARLREARTGYLPTFSLSTGLNGQATEVLNKDYLVAQTEQSLRGQRDSCELQNAISAGLKTPLAGYPKTCGATALTDAARQQLIASSETFPFNFNKIPMQVRLSVSMPIFNGFSTQRQVEQAVAAAKDATENRRAEELQLRTAVTQAYDNVVTQYQVIAIEETNRELAEQRLTMARQRYAAGASNIIDLLDAQSSMQTAEREYLNALYDFQIDLTRLEAASGVRLRPAA